MTFSFNFEAQLRDSKVVGTAASRRLRKAGRVPGVLYGSREQAPILLSMEHKVLLKAIENPALYSHILKITVEDTTYQAVLKSLPQHAYKPEILSFDLYRIVETEKIKISVPLRFIGENIAPGVKQEGGVMSYLLNNVEVACLPADLPEFLEVDLSKLSLNESISLSQLMVPKGVELVLLLHGDDRTIAMVHPLRVQTDADESTTPAAEGAITTPKASIAGKSDK